MFVHRLAMVVTVYDNKQKKNRFLTLIQQHSPNLKVNFKHTPMPLPGGAHGSTTPDFELDDCCQVSFDSGGLVSHGSGCSGFDGGFDSHGSLN